MKKDQSATPVRLIFLVLAGLLFCEKVTAQCDCDFVIPASEYWVDGKVLGVKPGDKVCLQNGTRKNMEFIYFNGTPENPVIITNMCDGTTTFSGTKSTPFSVQIRESSHFRFTGTNNPNEEYGIIITGTHMGLDVRQLSTNFEVDHIKVLDVGSVAFVGKTDPTCDTKTWFGNFVLRNSSFHDNYIDVTGDEGFYVGNSHYASGVTKNCSGSDIRVYEHEVVNVDVYNNIVLNTGRDGIQVGSCPSGCDIYDNYVENFATRAIFGHQSGIQINQGTVANIYRNKIVNGTGYGIFVSGSGGTRTVNNVVVNALQGGLFANDFPPLMAGASYVFLNNTLINNRDYGIYMLSEKTVNNLFANNIIIAPSNQPSFQYVRLNNPSAIKWIEHNNIKTTDATGVKFRDPSSYDFHLQSGSSAINSGADLTAFGVTSDFENNPRPSGGAFDIGAYEFPSNAPIANAGQDKTITLPTNTVVINGSGSSPTGSINSYKWTKKSGGAATLTNGSTAVLTVSDLVAGTYVFELEVTDANGSGLDQMTVTVLPVTVNQPPVASAGSDATITLPTNSISFSGSGTDLDGSIVGYLWEKVSGPTANLANATTNKVDITQLVEGVYEFRLTVQDDDGATGSDLVKLTVLAGAVNNLPTVNAGSDKTVIPPTSTVSLAGSATDSDGTIVSVLWEKRSGPVATIVDPSALTLQVQNLLVGTYIFRLTVTDDDGGVSYDEVQVTVTAGNQNPVANAGNDVTITAPTSTANLSGSGTDIDGSISSYQWIQVNGAPAILTNSDKATVTISGLAPGVYHFGLTVTDDDAAIGYDEVQITVNNAPVNQAPVAKAGPDKTLLLPLNTITLNGAGTDSDGSIVSYQWSKKSGPPVTLVNENTKDVTLNDLVVGNYVMTLGVGDDDGLTGSDDVIVTVLPAGTNQVPIANAGGNKYLTLPQTSVTLNGVGADPDGTIIEYLWTQEQGPAAALANENTADLSISNLVEGEYVFRFTISDNNGATSSDYSTVVVNATNLAPLVSAGSNVVITLPATTFSVTGSASDPDGTITSYLWNQVSGPAATLTDVNTSILQVTGFSAGTYVFSLEVTDDDGAPSNANVTVTVLPPSANQAPVSDAGNDQVVFLPTNSINLSGIGSDPDGSVTSYTWTQENGPAGATLINANTSSLTVVDLVQGTYVFRLTVQDDDGAVAFDNVVVTVNANTLNQPPTVSPGSNQFLQLPSNQITITGSASDPDGSIASYSWTKVSGPSCVLGNANTSTVSVSNLVEGAYVFRLTVTDNGGAVAFGEVRVVVFPAGVNKGPFANAGQNQILTLPTSSTNLVGAGFDADGTIASYAWAKLSGPTTFTLSDASSQIGSLSGLVEGVYVFRLTVTDNLGYTGFDDVTVTVVSETSNKPPVANAGGSQTIVLPSNTVNLFGTGTDTDGSITTYSWIKISGGTATLINPNLPTLTVTSLVAGNYVFRLRVTDNFGSFNDDFANVYVNSAEANLPPIANAGPDATVTLPNNSTSIVGTGSDADGTISSYLWEKVVGGSLTLSDPATPSVMVKDLLEGQYTMRFTVGDNGGNTDFDEMNLRVLAPGSNQAPLVTAGDDVTIYLPENAVTLNAEASDPDGEIAFYFWSKKSGPNVTLVNPNAQDVDLQDLQEGVYVFTLSVIDDDNTSTSDEVSVVVLPATVNQPPKVNAGPDVKIELPTNFVDIPATVTDPDGTIATIEWVQISGSPTTFDGSNATLSLTALLEGTYEFEIRAMDDDGSVSTDRVKIVVGPVPPNRPPVVDAGESQVVQLPTNTASFTGTAQDTDGTVASVVWTKRLGPQATLANTNTLNLTASDLVAGLYIFRLTATDDSGNTSFSEVLLVVVDITDAEPKPPIAYAGPDTLIVPPNNEIIIYGQGLDPDGTIASFEWSQISGATATFEANGNALHVSDLVVGEYGFRLTVRDNDDNVASDDVLITVLDKNSDLYSYIPKYFSPNNDGTNDTWTIQNVEVLKDCHLSVFSRDGRLVFESISYDNSWDGSYNGRPLSDGDYYYIIRFNGAVLASGGIRIIR